MSFTITDKEIKKGDKKHRAPKCECCREKIIGKVFPGGRCNRCHNEAINPHG